MTEARTVVVEADLDESPQKVWRALSEPDLLAAWLFPNDIRPERGERFFLDDHGRRIDCEVLQAEPGRRLRCSWREADGGLAGEVDFLLTPTPAGGTRLKVVHGAVVLVLTAARPQFRRRSSSSRALKMAA
ncbi:MAG: SRPBCC family protein [Caulobacteraceae bacterium]